VPSVSEEDRLLFKAGDETASAIFYNSPVNATMGIIASEMLATEAEM